MWLFQGVYSPPQRNYKYSKPEFLLYDPIIVKHIFLSQAQSDFPALLSMERNCQTPWAQEIFATPAGLDEHFITLTQSALPLEDTHSILCIRYCCFLTWFLFIVASIFRDIEISNSLPHNCFQFLPFIQFWVALKFYVVDEVRDLNNLSKSFILSFQYNLSIKPNKFRCFTF